MIEIGSKMCNPGADAYPGSLTSYFDANKALVKAQLQRDALIKERTAILQQKSDSLAEKSDGELHIEAIKLQIQTFNINFDAVTGSKLFKLDQNQDLATANAGIPQLEALNLKAMEAIEMNQRDHQDMVDAYNNLTQGIDASAQIAAEACKRKKEVEECTTSHWDSSSEGDNVTTCTKKLVDDPVPGSCEMATLLPPYKSGPVNEYAELYKRPKMASTALNNGMERIEIAMKTAVEGFPKSNDPNYDWTSPLLFHEKMAKQRKKVGVLCPGAAEEGSKEATELAQKATDFLLTLGVTGTQATKAGVIMNANWGEFDQVVGQPGNRAEFFGFAVKLINELLQIENQRLTGKLLDYDRLNAYYEAMKRMSSDQKLADCNSFVPGPTPPNPNCKGSGITPSSGSGGSKAAAPTQPNPKDANLGNNQIASGNNKQNSPQANALFGTTLAQLSQNDNETIKRNANSVRNGSSSGVDKSYSVAFGSAAGEFTVGPLSTTNLANARNIATEVRNNAAKLARLTTGPTTLASKTKSGSQQPSGMATERNSTFKSALAFADHMQETNRKLGTVEDYKEIASALNGSNATRSGTSAGSNTRRTYTTTTRDLGYSGNGAKWNGSSSSSSSSSSSGKAGASKETSTESQVASAKIGGSGPITDHSSVSKKRAGPMELFDNISNAYKKVGRQKLGVDEIRGDN